MNQTAERIFFNEVQPDPEAAPVVQPVPEVPPIKPEMAKLLELTQATGATTTAKEINAQLDRVLRDYEELTALYAQNNRRIDGELEALRQSGGALSGQMHQLAADLQQQSRLLVENSVASEQRVESLRGEARSWLAASEQRWDAELTGSNARIGADLSQLAAGIASLEGLFKAQEQILAQQHARLDQFDITHQLLDNATRSNRSRIEAAREYAERQHAIVETRLDGLGALQREHHAEFQKLQSLVGVLQSETRRIDEDIAKLRAELQAELRAETQRLDAAVASVGTALAEQESETRHRFKKTHLAIAAVAVLAAAGFALVKWVPAFGPATDGSALAQNEAKVVELGSQVAGLTMQSSAQQELDARQQASIDDVSGKVASLEKSLADLRTAMRGLRLPGAGAAVLHDSQWLLQQNPNAYTVQLVTSPSEANMARFIERNVKQLALSPLAFSVSTNEQRERYSLYFGTFRSVAQARAAITALPPELQVNRPWVRQMQSVQDTLR